MMIPDLPFKELSERWLIYYQREYYRRNIFWGKDNFSLGNHGFKEPVRYLKLYELICQMWF